MPERRTAPGIPDRDDPGAHTRLRPGQLVDWLVSRHDAARAGLHRDVRLGTPETGLLSWATKKELPGPGHQVVLHGQPVHAHGYLGFAGEIPAGRYGAGRVSREDLGQALITAVGPDTLEFSLAHRKHPSRYLMNRPKGWPGTSWLTRNVTSTGPVPYAKVHYKSVPPGQAESHLSQLGPADIVQPKIDGSSTVVRIGPNRKVDLFSYRSSKRDNLPISHTERVFGGRPRLESLPRELLGSVLRGELYAKDRTGKVLPPQALGALLNATLANSLREQRDRGVGLHAALFDIQRRGRKPVDFEKVPYAERRRMLGEFLPHLPGRFHLAEQVQGPEAARELWRAVIAGRNPHTREGVVIHPERGRPAKIKQTEDADVHVTGTYPGKGRRAATVGGLTYALESGGPTVGRVGSGLTDETLRMLAADPGAFRGRIARIRAQEQHPSGAHRAPRFLAWHEDYSSE